VASRANTPRRFSAVKVQNLIDHVRKTCPAAVKGVVPEIAGIGLVQRVLQHLAREQVSIRDVVAILETIADEAERTKDAAAIGEAARRRLSAAICASLADADGRIRAAVLTPEFEARLATVTISDDRGPALALEIGDAHALASRLRALTPHDGGRSVVCCAQPIRLALSRFADLCDVDVSVLGLGEVVPGFFVHPEETFDVASSN
jgi:flagellar biosynthesis protein FlhA